MVPLEVIWKGLWSLYRPLQLDSKYPGVPKGIVIGKIMALPEVTVRDTVSTRIAHIWICKCLPRIFSNDCPKEYLEKNLSDESKGTFLLEPVAQEDQANRMKTIPPIPPAFKDELKNELRMELVGRKSMVGSDLQNSNRNAIKRSATELPNQPQAKRPKRNSLTKTETLVIPDSDSVHPTPLEKKTTNSQKAANSPTPQPLFQNLPKSQVSSSSKSVKGASSLKSSSSASENVDSPAFNPPFPQQNQNTVNFNFPISVLENIKNSIGAIKREVEDIRKYLQRSETSTQNEILTLRSEINQIKSQITARPLEGAVDRPRIPRATSVPDKRLLVPPKIPTIPTTRSSLSRSNSIDSKTPTTPLPTPINEALAIPPPTIPPPTIYSESSNSRTTATTQELSNPPTELPSVPTSALPPPAAPLPTTEAAPLPPPVPQPSGSEVSPAGSSPPELGSVLQQPSQSSQALPQGLTLQTQEVLLDDKGDQE